MNHHHLIFHPRDMEGTIANLTIPWWEFLDIKADKYHACVEVGQGGLHAHIYIITSYSKDTICDNFKQIMKIPKSTKGKRNLYYSDRLVDEHPVEYPEQDLRKFTLGYVQKNLNPVANKGFTPEELEEALEYYSEITEARAKAETEKRKEAQNLVINTQAEEKEPRETLGETWAEYVCWFKQQLQKVDNAPFDMTLIKRLSRKFWASKNDGLFPPGSTYARFTASIAYKLREQMTQDIDTTLENTPF